MADPYSPDNNSWAMANFNVHHLREGAHIAYLPIGDDIPRLIGLVAAHWGSFEIRFNLILDALLRATGRQEPGWDRLAFKRRKELLVHVVKNSLDPRHAVVAKAPLLAVCGAAADLHWRRNTVLHGTYRIHFQVSVQKSQPSGPKVCIMASP